MGTETRHLDHQISPGMIGQVGCLLSHSFDAAWVEDQRKKGPSRFELTSQEVAPLAFRQPASRMLVQLRDNGVFSCALTGAGKDFHFALIGATSASRSCQIRVPSRPSFFSWAPGWIFFEVASSTYHLFRSAAPIFLDPFGTLMTVLRSERG